MTLRTNLTAYYEMDEASGDALDSIGALDLTDHNSVGTAAGKINTARDFESLSLNYFDISDSTFSPGDTDFTFACWIKAESLVNFSKNNSTDREFALFYDTNNNQIWWGCYDNSASQKTAQNTASISTGTWYHVVCWHDSVADQIGVTVNAGTPFTASISGGVRQISGPFQVGASTSQVLYWDGLIDELGYWSRVLTSQERTDLYNGGSGMPLGDFGNYTLTVDTGTLTLTGGAVTLTVTGPEAIVLTAATGILTLTGNAATLTASGAVSDAKILVAGPGVLTLTGGSIDPELSFTTTDTDSSELVAAPAGRTDIIGTGSYRR